MAKCTLRKSPDPADIVRDLPGETEVRDEVCDQLVAKMNVLSSELKDAPDQPQAGVPPALGGRRRARRRGIALGARVGYGPRVLGDSLGAGDGRRAGEPDRAPVNRLALTWGASTRGGSKSPDL